MGASGVTPSRECPIIVLLVSSFSQPFLEIPDSFSDPPGDLGDTLCPEEQDHQAKDEKDFTDSETHELPAPLAVEKKIPAGALTSLAAAGSLKMAIAVTDEKA